MPRQNLMNVISALFSDGVVLQLEEVARLVMAEYPGVSESEFKSATLGLLRRGDLVLTESFSLSARTGGLVAA
jgi:hypothetical protein